MHLVKMTMKWPSSMIGRGPKMFRYKIHWKLTILKEYSVRIKNWRHGDASFYLHYVVSCRLVCCESSFRSPQYYEFSEVLCSELYDAVFRILISYDRYRAVHVQYCYSEVTICRHMIRCCQCYCQRICSLSKFSTTVL